MSDLEIIITPFAEKDMEDIFALNNINKSLEINDEFKKKFNTITFTFFPFIGVKL